MVRMGLLAALLVAAGGSPVGHVPPTVIPAFSGHAVINGVTVTVGGRVFVSVQPQSEATPLEVAEIVQGKLRPFPDAEWNSWREGDDGAARFVGVNAVRIGPDGALWVVDKGMRGPGDKAVPPGPKILRFDLDTGRLTRRYDLADAAGTGAFINDIRLNGRFAYITETAKGSIIVLDLKTGAARRVLDGHPALQGRPLIAEGRPLRFIDGRPVSPNADQLEVSPDGGWLYVQPPSGPLSRIETRFLDDPKLSAKVLADHVKAFSATPPIAGTAIDGDGAIYAGDLERSRILRIDSTGAIQVVVQDPRLVWPDAMWIDAKGDLWVPASQLDRTKGLNGGVDAVEYPVRIYKIHVGGSASVH